MRCLQSSLFFITSKNTRLLEKAMESQSIGLKLLNSSPVFPTGTIPSAMLL